MLKENDYRFIGMDGLIDVITISPSKEYYYKLKKPTELNKSAYGCLILFLESKSDKTIYHRKNSYAHEIHSKEEIDELRMKMVNNSFSDEDLNRSLTFVHWSSDGRFAYFVEYIRKVGLKVFDSVILNLQEESCYRINELDDDFKIANQLGVTKNLFDSNFVIKRLEFLNIKKQAAFNDKNEF